MTQPSKGLEPLEGLKGVTPHFLDGIPTWDAGSPISRLIQSGDAGSESGMTVVMVND